MLHRPLTRAPPRSESAFIISGLGYNPQTKHYDASRNVRIRSIEFAPNFKVRLLSPSTSSSRSRTARADGACLLQVLLDSWNMNTNVWLRECIYKRVAKKGRKPGCVGSLFSLSRPSSFFLLTLDARHRFKSTQITFITSALCVCSSLSTSSPSPFLAPADSTTFFVDSWHGVNPCYLMTFVLGGFCQALNRSLRAGLRPFFLPPGALQAPNPLSASAPPLPKLDVLKHKQAVEAAKKDGGAAAVVKVPGTTERVKLAAPPQTPLKIAYDVAGTLATQAVLSASLLPPSSSAAEQAAGADLAARTFLADFAVVPFLLLDVHSSILAWRSVSYYGLALVFVPFVVLNFLGGLPALKKAQRKRDAEAAKRHKRTTEEDEQERRRVEWEKSEEDKRRRRGEGVPSLGIDVEELVEEEEREERRREAERKAQ